MHFPFHLLSPRMTNQIRDEVFEKAPTRRGGFDSDFSTKSLPYGDYPCKACVMNDDLLRSLLRKNTRSIRSFDKPEKPKLLFKRNGRSMSQPRTTRLIGIQIMDGLQSGCSGKGARK